MHIFLKKVIVIICTLIRENNKKLCVNIIVAMTLALADVGPPVLPKKLSDKAATNERLFCNAVAAARAAAIAS